MEWGPEAGDLVLSIRQAQPAEWPVFTLDLDFEVEGGGADGRRASVRVDPDVSVLATAALRRR